MSLKSPEDPLLASRLITRSTFFEQLASSGVHFDKLVVGVAIFHSIPSTTSPVRVLIVRRAAHEKLFPNVYEIPGGHVEDSDESILHAAAREILEETGLIVEAFIGETPSFEYSTQKILPEGTAVTKTTLQLNFAAKTASGDASGALKVTLNPDEHQSYAWASKADLDQYDFTPEMMKVVSDALDWGERNIDRLVTD